MGSTASKVAADGSQRSAMAVILDPVGACIQPADLSPWNPAAIDAAVAASPQEPKETQVAEWSRDSLYGSNQVEMIVESCLEADIDWWSTSVSMFKNVV